MMLQEIETALDEDRVEANMQNGRWWKVRRNGKTRTWKRNPNRFEIPIKAGFNVCGTIEPHSFNAGYFRITPRD